MPLIEIVSHCWRYSRLLCYQLSSFLLHPPTRNQAKVTLFYSPEDMPTVQCLEWFHSQSLPGSVGWNFQPLSRPELLRRSIGRNLAAKTTAADIMWFTDCDYLFGPGALDYLELSHFRQSPLVFPKRVLTCRSHEIGDQYVARVTGPAVYGWEDSDFGYRRMRRAIGGVQIVSGDTARRKGYVPNNGRDQRPAVGTMMTDFTSDIRFRVSLGTAGQPILMPNVFRLRHSVAGRFQEVDL